MVDPTSSPDVHFSRSRRGKSGSRQLKIRLTAALILLLLLVIVAPPYLDINHFRRGIVQSISAELGRPVQASAVELTLFPRPAFVLHGLTVAEDPAYGAEPVLMADTVTASLRASTLWHRRVEIARLEFDAPSLNLARNGAGQWNFESLLHRSSALRSASAPKHPQPFPYVEATEARINFKVGPEKLPFSLEGADLALWKESGNAWHLRIQARPVRTDLTVADTGQIRGEGVVRATGPLANAPIQATLEWRRVQLGEISRLLHGEDEGWRGTVDWTAQAKGTLADLLLTSDIQIEEFRRDEFVPPAEMTIGTHCEARYLYASRSFASLQCHAPLGSGQLVVLGKGPLAIENTMQTNSGSQPRSRVPKARPHSGSRTVFSLDRIERTPQPSLQIALQHAPAGFFLHLLSDVHPGIASDIAATGELNGQATCTWLGPQLSTLRTCAGEVQSTAVTINLPHLGRPLRLAPVILNSSETASAKALPDGTWILGPSHVSMGAVKPATLSGALTPTGATLKIMGAADLAEVFNLAQALKIPAISGQVRSLRGSAQLALAVDSEWLPQTAATGTSSSQATQFAPSHWSGSFQIHNATLRLVSLPGTVQLTSAQVNLTPTMIDWTELTGTYHRVAFDGSMHWQTPCATSTSLCDRTFALHLPNLNTGHLQADLRNGGGPSGLLSLVDPWAGTVPTMPKISGTVDIDMLTVGKISVKNATLGLSIEGHKAELHSISGSVFGGTLSAETAREAEGPAGSARWGNGAPSYTLHIELQHVQPDSIGAIWREHWGRGQANADIELTTQGWSAEDLSGHAAGKFSVAWSNGAFASAAMASTPAAKFQQWEATGTIANKTLLLQSSQMIPSQITKQPQPVTQSVTGTVNFDRRLDLHFLPSGMALKGTLSKPIPTLPIQTRTQPR